jgi:hypothetical protein
MNLPRWYMNFPENLISLKPYNIFPPHSSAKAEGIENEMCYACENGKKNGK